MNPMTDKQRFPRLHGLTNRKKIDPRPLLGIGAVGPNRIERW